MAATYTIANAVTEICHKVKDYGEIRYGANDSKSYFRALKLFWDSVLSLIKPTEDLKKKYPGFYQYALGIKEEDIWGLVTTATQAFASGIITLTSLTSFMHLISWSNYTGANNIVKNIRIVTPEKFNGMAKTQVYPPNTVYICQFGNILKITPTTETGSIDITYVKTPDNSLATSTSLLTLFSFTFIRQAVALAAEKLKEEIGGV